MRVLNVATNALAAVVSQKFSVTDLEFTHDTLEDVSFHCTPYYCTKQVA